jgi:hypothetical protein
MPRPLLLRLASPRGDQHGLSAARPAVRGGAAVAGPRIDAITVWSSAICTAYGLAYAVGAAKAWCTLS